MHRHSSERGAALILLMGIAATLMIMAATLVMVLLNQQHATASERKAKTSVYYAEAALDKAVADAKVDTDSMPKLSTDPSWPWSSVSVGRSQLLAALVAAGFPANGTVDYRVYDNLTTVNPSIQWDQNNDGRMWLEVTITYQGKVTRTRVLVTQTTENVVTALPRAVLYSDTDISLQNSSDLYSLRASDGQPYTAGSPYPTTVMSGGSLRGSGNQDLAAYNASPRVQSIGVNVNGSVSGLGFTPDGVKIGGVGLLSDYFDQGAQADLGDEAQTGATHAAAPTAPAASGTAVAASAFSQANILTIPGSSYNAGTKTYTFTNDLNVTGSLTLKSGIGSGAGVFPAGTKFVFKSLYLNGNSSLTLTDQVTVSTTALSVGGALTISSSASVTDQFGPVYAGGNVSVSGPVTLSAVIGTTPQSFYSGGNVTITGPASQVTDQFGLLYVAGALSVTNDVQLKSTALVAMGDFTLSGADAGIIDYLGPIYVGGSARWSGTVSVKTTDYTKSYAEVDPADTTTWTLATVGPTAINPPGPMWIGAVFAHTWPGTGGSWRYHDVYGYTWISGNAGTGNVAINYTGPTSGTTPCTVMCTLMSTTEKTTTSGRVDFGTTDFPMTYFMQCDNDGLYSNTCEWGSTGTFYGLMVVMEAVIQITGGNGQQPCVVGAVFEGTPYVSGTTGSTSDITLTGSSTVAYNQAVIDKVKNYSITTTTLVTTIVPGSWQQLSTN